MASNFDRTNESLHEFCGIMGLNPNETGSRIESAIFECLVKLLRGELRQTEQDDAPDAIQAAVQEAMQERVEALEKAFYEHTEREAVAVTEKPAEPQEEKPAKRKPGRPKKK